MNERERGSVHEVAASNFARIKVHVLECLLESLSATDRDKPAGVVIAEAICDARERMGKHA